MGPVGYQRQLMYSVLKSKSMNGVDLLVGFGRVWSNVPNMNRWMETIKRWRLRGVDESVWSHGHGTTERQLSGTHIKLEE